MATETWTMQSGLGAAVLVVALWSAWRLMELSIAVQAQGDGLRLCVAARVAIEGVRCFRPPSRFDIIDR